jgi:hypothetical protein
MTIMKLPLIMDRIKHAPPSSPIAVFRTSVAGHLDAVFAATLESIAVIKAGPQSYIGTFHGECDLKWVKDRLEEQIIGEPA